MMAGVERHLANLGFRFGRNGPHAARTMMLDELRALLAQVPVAASRADYVAAIVERNRLGKPTRRTRELTARHLAALYGLDPANPLFRALRRLWPHDERAQPLLALVVALARDPLLRMTWPLVQDMPVGTRLPREVVEHHLAHDDPERFSAASLTSFAQNTLGTWTAAGFLNGRVRKIRSAPVVQPENVALCLFLGYLEGRSGQRLFTSSWMQLLGLPLDALEALAGVAAERGWLVLRQAGDVKEVRFPDMLTIDEERRRQEVVHVL
jgi:hypothetical protein